MTSDQRPDHYLSIRERFPEITEALENLGKVARSRSALDEKTGHLVQLAAAAALQSEGAVHSHVRRALQAGASSAEIQDALLQLVSTIGFPRVAAALSWADDEL